jgi:hypothetical protein
MEKKSNAGTAFVMLFLIVVVVFGYHFATKQVGQLNQLDQIATAASYTYQQVQETPLVQIPTADLYQPTVEAFYAAPAVSTPIPTIEIPTQAPALPSIKLTTCIDSPIFSTTNYGQEYIIGMAAKGLTFDITERSSDSQWVKLAQSNETYEFWLPAVAFCFVP